MDMKDGLFSCYREQYLEAFTRCNIMCPSSTTAVSQCGLTWWKCNTQCWPVLVPSSGQWLSTNTCYYTSCPVYFGYLHSDVSPQSALLGFIKLDVSTGWQPNQSRFPLMALASTSRYCSVTFTSIAHMCQNSSNMFCLHCLVSCGSLYLVSLLLIKARSCCLSLSVICQTYFVRH